MITEDDNIRGRAATMKREEGKFAQKRKWIQALRDFKPGMEEEERDVPVELVILVFFAVVGFLHILGYMGIGIMYLTR